MDADIADAIAVHGFAVIPDAVPSNVVSRLRSLLEPSTSGDAKGSHGMRNVVGLIPEIREDVNGHAIRSLIDQIVGSDAFLVRSIFFDKTARANWKVPWHQDRSIAVQQRIDIAGFGPWSLKGGIVHVEAPADILQGMLTVRLHLDDCGEHNGPLRVIPGSHLRGKLAVARIQYEKDARPPVSCLVAAGGALLMRPLLLHASSAAQWPCHRRVLHLEFASCRLPGGLRWACEPTTVRE
jgi:hypothetical protein